MEAVLAVVIALVVVAAVFVFLRRRRGAPPAGVSVPGARIEGDRVIVPLDITSTDGDHPAVVRLVDDAAGRVFLSAPESVRRVEVRNRDDLPIGLRDRSALPPELTMPDHLPTSGAPRSDAPEVPPERGDAGSPTATPRPAAPGADPGRVEERVLADRFELADMVRSRVEDPSDPVDIVRAILEAAGLESAVEGDVLRAGDRAVVVVRTRIGGLVDPNALNTAYQRFKDSGARRGVVVTPGSMSQSDLRRRQAFDSSLLHAGPEGIQRMADAAEVGADPIEFAATSLV